MHEDLEIAVPREQFSEIAETLAGYELFIPDGDLTDPGLVWPFARRRRHSTDTSRRGYGRRRLGSGGSMSSASLPRAIRGSTAATNGSGCLTVT